MNPDPTSLDRLHDIVAPAPVPWWPPAPGWYWVLGAVAAVFLAVVVRAVIRWQHNRYRREALAEWRRQEAITHDANQRVAALAELAELLKRTALSAFPRKQVASLTGVDWQSFLVRTGGATSISPSTGALLESAAYDPRVAAKLDQSQVVEATAMVRNWIAHHRTADPK